MSENDLSPEVIADILEVLGWIKRHPNGKREDMGELFDVYKKWRAIIFELKLLDDTRNQRTLGGLSSYGEAFLLKYGGKSEATPPRKRGRHPDKTIDPKQDQRIMDAWLSRRWRTYEELANELHLTKRQVELAIDREEKRRAKSQDKP